MGQRNLGECGNFYNFAGVMSKFQKLMLCMAAAMSVAANAKTISQSLKARIDYVKNPEKTNGGELITAYACSPETADAEFLLARNEYLATTGRTHRNEVIAYQLRQSFKPGEVTPEEANQIGYELASQFLRGDHAFIVASRCDARDPSPPTAPDRPDFCPSRTAGAFRPCRKRRRRRRIAP